MQSGVGAPDPCIRLLVLTNLLQLPPGPLPLMWHNHGQGERAGSTSEAG